MADSRRAAHEGKDPHPVTTWTVRRTLTASAITAALAVSLAACSGDDDDTSDNGSETTSSDTGTPTVPEWPSSVSEADFTDEIEDRASSILDGDCSVMTEDLTAALQRISYKAGLDGQLNDWQSVTVSDGSSVSAPAPTSKACEYDVTGMTVAEVGDDIRNGEVTKITIGALPANNNRFTPEDRPAENGALDLDAMDYIPIGQAAVGVAEEMVEAGDAKWQVQDGSKTNATSGMVSALNSGSSYLYSEMPSVKGKTFVPGLEATAQPGYWVKVDGTTDTANLPERTILSETATRLMNGLLLPNNPGINEAQGWFTVDTPAAEEALSRASATGEVDSAES